MLVIQLLILFFATFSLSTALFMFKEKKIRVGDFLFWLVLWAAVIITSITTKYADFISKLLGVSSGINVLVYMGIIVLFYLIFRLYVKIDIMQKSMTNLVRELSYTHAKQRQQMKGEKNAKKKK